MLTPSRFLSISLNSNSMDELLRDTDSEEEGETKGARKPRDRTQAKLAWLQEGGDIMDFLDPSASKKVLGKSQEMLHFNRVGGIVLHVWKNWYK